VTETLEPHRGGLILAMGITAVILSCCYVPFGVVPWVMGARDLARMRAGEMDPAGRSLTQAGQVCGIVGTAASALNLLLTAVLWNVDTSWIWR